MVYIWIEQSKFTISLYKVNGYNLSKPCDVDIIACLLYVVQEGNEN